MSSIDEEPLLEVSNGGKGVLRTRNRRASRYGGPASTRLAVLCRGRPKFAACATFLAVALAGLCVVSINHISFARVKLKQSTGTTFIKVFQAETSQATSQKSSTASASTTAANQYLEPLSPDLVNYDDIHSGKTSFDIRGDDVMVFLHIQKTGGTTFGKHLVRDIDLERPCECVRKKKKKKSRQWEKEAWENMQAEANAGQHEAEEDEEEEDEPLTRDKRMLRCDCLRPGGGDDERQWLFSRHSTGWQCGLHADWTELRDCVDGYFQREEDEEARKRRYFYVTFLRQPVGRYLSEWRHVQRGATWKKSLHACNGRIATKAELPKCYAGEDWLNVSLADFMACESNLAVNRQTRMLADLTLVNCYNVTEQNPEERGEKMLASAKRNLRSMAFFGMVERQEESQHLFEDTFRLRFNSVFEQYDHELGEKLQRTLSEETVERIRQLNSLDVRLYAYAKQLLDERAATLAGGADLQ